MGGPRRKAEFRTLRGTCPNRSPPIAMAVSQSRSASRFHGRGAHRALPAGLPTREDDATKHDVSGQFRWRLIEGELDGVDDCLSWLVDCFSNLRTREQDRLGRPVIRSRPRTSAEGSSAYGQAEPMAIFTCSAVRSPRSTLYSFFTHSITASSSSSPPVRIERLTTIPPRDMTATSVVPPPMSTTIDPDGSPIGSPQPMAAAIGSSIVYARRAPA